MKNISYLKLHMHIQRSEDLESVGPLSANGCNQMHMPTSKMYIINISVGMKMSTLFFFRLKSMQLYDNIYIKYDGYLKRQMIQVEQFRKLEEKKIPESIDYDAVGSLRIEARQKLKEYRPISIGQASRISGVSPADVSVLLVYLERR